MSCCSEQVRSSLYEGRNCSSRTGVTRTSCFLLRTFQFFDSRRNFFGLGRYPVPLGVVFHERNAFALDRVGNDGGRFAAAVGAGLLQRWDDFVEVVAVELYGI